MRFICSISKNKFFIATLLAMSLALSACATGPRQAVHSFSFDGWSDKWATQVDLLEYSYGDQYHMVRDKVRPPKERLGQSAGVNGMMPVADFLYVKWRIKATGEILEDRVDLRNRVPFNMNEHGVTFVIDGRQLYVYLVTPRPKNEDAPPILKTYRSWFNVTYEIYPTNTFNQ